MEVVRRAPVAAGAAKIRSGHLEVSEHELALDFGKERWLASGVAVWEAEDEYQDS